jgi:hypothetical protein
VRVEITVVITLVRLNIKLRVKITLCVLKSHSACGNYTLRVEITLFVWKLRSETTLVRMNITHSDFYTHSVILTRMSVNTHTCQHHTLRVEITLVRIEITVVSVVITYVRVKITLRMEITLYVYESHSCLLKSHFLFRNYTCACVHHTMHACKNNTLHVEITFCV